VHQRELLAVSVGLYDWSQDNQREIDAGWIATGDTPGAAAIDGAPIAGLFSAGEMGQAVGLMYPASGASLSEALCLGELAGESTMD
jgi:hypothetical protein